MKTPAIYIMANKKNGTVYTGVTSHLIQRVYQHKHGITGGFTKKHGCHSLVYYEIHGTMESAILREKQLKGGARQKKLDLIQAMNPEWKDLYSQIV